MDVGVQAFGVADVLEDPSAKVCQAAVLREHQPRPGVTLSHIKGRDSHGTPNLRHNINWFKKNHAIPIENQVKFLSTSQQHSFDAFSSTTEVDGDFNHCTQTHVSWLQ